MKKRLIVSATLASLISAAAHAVVTCPAGYQNAKGHCVVPNTQKFTYHSGINWPDGIVTSSSTGYKKGPDGVTASYGLAEFSQFSTRLYSVGQYAVWITGSGTTKRTCYFDAELKKVICEGIDGSFNLNSGTRTIYTYKP